MTNSAIYILTMATAGLLVYTTAFFLIPIPTLETEVARWREKIGGGMSMIRKPQ